MKPIGILLVAALGCAGLPALAQCSGNLLSQGQIQSLVAGNLVCGRAVIPGYPGDPSDRFQEEHFGSNSGNLFDFKKGSNPIDPRKLVGSWSTAGGNPATITHLYGALSFTWQVFGNLPNVAGTTTYSFCTTGGVEHVRAHVRPINVSVGCNGIYPP